MADVVTRDDRSRQPVALFLIAVFGVTWALCFILRSSARPGSVWTILAWLFPTVWSPTLVAVVLMRAERGAVRMREEIRALVRWTGPGRWYVVAAVLPALATLTAVAVARAAGAGAPFVAPAAIPLVVVVQLATGAVGEELGWRGFLLPRLDRRFGGTSAAWMMAIFWSLWHVAAFFVPGMPHQVMPPLMYLAFTALFGYFLAVLFSRTGESVLAPVMAHLSLNIMMGMGGVALSSVVFWWAMVGLFGALALSVATTSSLRPRSDAARQA